MGFVLLLYPWLRMVVEEPGSCCGRNPCSILVIPNTKVETMIIMTNLVTMGNLKVTKSWKKEHIMSLLSFTYASDIDIKVNKVAVDNICPVYEKIFKIKDGVLKHRQHHSNPTCHLSLLPYKCRRCPMVFANCKDLFYHKAYHTEVWLAPPKEKDENLRFESQ